MRACMNLSFLLSIAGREANREVIEHGIDARASSRRPRLGAQPDGRTSSSSYLRHGPLGRPRARRRGASRGGTDHHQPGSREIMLDLAQVAIHRGDTERVLELVSEYAAWEESAHVQARGVRIWRGRCRAGRRPSRGRSRGVSSWAARSGADEERERRRAVAHRADASPRLRSARPTRLPSSSSWRRRRPADAGPPLAAKLALQRARLATLRNEEDAAVRRRRHGLPWHSKTHCSSRPPARAGGVARRAWPQRGSCAARQRRRARRSSGCASRRCSNAWRFSKPPTRRTSRRASA